jgi:hypothetical protein
MDHVIVATRQPVGGQAVPLGNTLQGAVAIFHSKVPFDQGKIHRFHGGSTNIKMARYHGKWYYENTDQSPAADWTYLCMPSARIMVVMPKGFREKDVQEIMDSDGTQATLAPELAALARQVTSSLGGMVVRISPSMRNDLKPQGGAGVPPDQVAVIQNLQQAQAYAAWLHLKGSKAQGRLAVACPDAATARRLSA